MMSGLFYFAVEPNVSLVISQEFYGGKLSVFCSSSYRSTAGADASHSPLIVRSIFGSVVDRNVVNDPDFVAVTTNLKRIAALKRNNNEISDTEVDEIDKLIIRFGPYGFKPMVIVIDQDKVEDRILQVDKDYPGNLFGLKYYIPDLNRSEVSLIDSYINSKKLIIK